MTTAQLPKRFIDKIYLDTEGHWLWLAAKNNGGYGVFSVNRIMRYAHRVAYETLIGPIPEGLQLDHLCRVRHCVNPKHLEPVTPGENIRRGVLPEQTRVRHASKTHCPRNHEYSGSNLYLAPDGRRSCRECKKVQMRGYRAEGFKVQDDRN